MKLSFHGAAKTVTGSKHIISLDNGKNILLDCGMFQGLGAETEELNNHFGFKPNEIDVLLLSHAHIDHSGLIPKLVKEGFTGKIFCTQATKDLTEILLYDSAEIQTYETELINKKRQAKGIAIYEPLYSSENVESCLKQFEIAEYNQWINITDNVSVLFTPVGHLVGSAAVTVRTKEGRKTTTILYSGDVGRYHSVLLQAPAEAPQADYIILESTYGDKHHDIRFNTIEILHDWIKRICVEKKGQLVIPAFSVGRTQEVLYALNQLSLEKRLPEILYFIDSPLSLKATQTIKKYTEQFNERLQKVLLIDDDPFEFPGLKYVETIEDSKRLVDYKEPCVIISASGTADAGRVRHHINSCIGNNNCAVLLSGYCGPKTLGGQLLSGTTEIELFNEPCTVCAEVDKIDGMSAHGDVDDLLQFVSNQNAARVKGIFLVHGEAAVQKTFTEKLSLKGFKRIENPAIHESFELPLKPVRKRKRIPLDPSLKHTNDIVRVA
ncbi:MAG: MBL fold metallo-hydrolase [Parafilimonas sp.]|nr:MBL fold metallo-hydrolase [Parafilimonas sp.]